ncbi:MAG: 16S rRNA (guanine(966)-N(2))-methyltransferase RsmD [Pseudomonadota bacterium]
MVRTVKRSRRQNTLRIIGGKWRGRKLLFNPEINLRPTPDRVRETLFNWLSPEINGARCLDLFAGSGALGLEALSRGAISCDFVDSSAAAVAQIQQHLRVLLNEPSMVCQTMVAERFLSKAELPYDIVFLDPPFDLELLEPACSQLHHNRLITEGGLVYAESHINSAELVVPCNWGLLRDKCAGEVRYRLFQNQRITTD